MRYWQRSIFGWHEIGEGCYEMLYLLSEEAARGEFFLAPMALAETLDDRPPPDDDEPPLRPIPTQPAIKAAPAAPAPPP